MSTPTPSVPDDGPIRWAVREPVPSTTEPHRYESSPPTIEKWQHVGSDLHGHRQFYIVHPDDPSRRYIRMHEVDAPSHLQIHLFKSVPDAQAWWNKRIEERKESLRRSIENLCNLWDRARFPDALDKPVTKEAHDAES